MEEIILRLLHEVNLSATALMSRVVATLPKKVDFSLLPG
jgi:hypothetical protein